MIPISRSFSKIESVKGTIVLRDIGAGVPLRSDDIQREQVIATQDITEGVVLSTTLVSQTWSVYVEGAATDIASVVQHKTLLALKKGMPILTSAVEQQAVATSIPTPNGVQLTGRSLVSVETRLGSLARTLKPLQPVILMLTHRPGTTDTSGATFVCDVILVDIVSRNGEDWLSVAIPNERIKEIGSSLATAVVTIVQSPSRTPSRSTWSTPSASA
jgi:hypothetical protein